MLSGPYPETQPETRKSQGVVRSRYWAAAAARAAWQTLCSWRILITGSAPAGICRHYCATSSTQSLPFLGPWLRHHEIDPTPAVTSRPGWTLAPPRRPRGRAASQAANGCALSAYCCGNRSSLTLTVTQAPKSETLMMPAAGLASEAPGADDDRAGCPAARPPGQESLRDNKLGQFKVTRLFNVGRARTIITHDSDDMAGPGAQGAPGSGSEQGCSENLNTEETRRLGFH